MTNALKRKGDEWERDARDFIRAQGVECARIPAGTSQDIGDLFLPPPAGIVQCKNRKEFALAAWMDEAVAEMHNAERSCAWLLVKRPRRPTGDAYLITTLALGWPYLTSGG